MSENPTTTILMAEDDADDRQLTREAMTEARVPNDLRCVVDGEDLMDYLHRRGAYAGDEVEAPMPGIILLDLNMPRKDGREALAEIKSDPSLRHIPVVVLTTSKARKDVMTSYTLGASSFITKPRSYSGLVEMVRDFSRYWFDIAALPGAVRV